MKNGKWFAVMAMVFAAVLVLAGCGGDSGSADAKAKFAGSWEVCSGTLDGEEYSEDDMAMLKDMGLSITLELRDDDTMAIDFSDGEPLEGTWSATDSVVTVKAEGDTATLKVDGDMLVMELDGDILNFQRAS